jgi:hypothetical protein
LLLGCFPRCLDGILQQEPPIFTYGIAMSNFLSCPGCQEQLPHHGYGEYRCEKCGAAFELKQLTAEEVAQLQEGPIRHESLPADLQEAVEWSFQVVGRYVHPTLEQWEIGFMRDMHPESEIRIWCRIALAFIRYHEERGLPLRDETTERDLIGTLISVSSGVEPADDEERFIEECYRNPKGTD